MSVKSPLHQKKKMKVSRSFDLSLSESIDEKITYQRESLTLFPVDANQDPGDAPMFEQLILLGARPMCEFIKDAPAEILCAYPSGRIKFTKGESDECVQGYTDIPLFCFPDGFVELGKQCELIIEQFVTTVGEKYCVCTIFQVPSLFETFFCNTHSRRYPFCLCMVTSHLNLGLQFRYMSCVIGAFVGDREFVVNEEVEPVVMNELDIPGLVSEDGVQKMKDLNVPWRFINELCWVREIRPKEDETQTVSLGPDFPMVVPAKASLDQNVALATMDTLFSALSVEHVLKCLSLMLLGERVLFLSTSKTVLSMSMLCMRELIKPYKYIYAFRPLLPNGPVFLDLADAPHPYAYGYIKPFDGLSKEHDYAVVDLDKNHISCMEHALMIPKVQSLESRIKKLRKSAKKLSPPTKLRSFIQIRNSSYGKSVLKRLSPCHIEETYWLNRRKYIFEESLVKDILANVQSYIVPDEETQLKPCFITDTTDIDRAVTIFNNNLFLYGIEDYAKQFFTEFVQTPIWMAFQTECTERNAQSVDHQMKDNIVLSRKRSGSKSTAHFDLS